MERGWDEILFEARLHEHVGRSAGRPGSGYDEVRSVVCDIPAVSNGERGEGRVECGEREYCPYYTSAALVSSGRKELELEREKEHCHCTVIQFVR